jgi:hypothetical protein
MKKITFKIAILVAVFVVVSVAHAQTGGSWSNPTATPPGNNVSAPLHVGSAAQEKQGTLGVRGTTGAFRIYDRETPTDSWALYAARDNASTNSWLRLWNYQDLRDQLSVDRTGMRLFGNLWSGGVVSGTLQVTGGSPKTGMVLKSTDDFGTAAWSENTEGATILVADLVIPNLTSIGSTGTNVTPFTVSVTGARVGDLASVAYPAGYSYDQMTSVCGATTATVSAANTVKVQFWNSYGSASCIIPNGTYKINVIQKGGGQVNTVAQQNLSSQVYRKRIDSTSAADMPGRLYADNPTDIILSCGGATSDMMSWDRNGGATDRSLWYLYPAYPTTSTAENPNRLPYCRCGQSDPNEEDRYAHRCGLMTGVFMRTQ